MHVSAANLFEELHQLAAKRGEIVVQLQDNYMREVMIRAQLRVVVHVSMDAFDRLTIENDKREKP